MKYVNIIILISFLSFLLACSDDPTYSPGEMWKMGAAVEPDMNIRQLGPNEAHLKILCSQYTKTPGCIGLGTDHSGMRIKVRLVELIILQFDTEEHAKDAARAYGQYYARNWLFDDVMDEPVLEDFVKRAFGAKAP